MGARILVTGVANLPGEVSATDLARRLRPHRLTAIVHNDVLQFAEPGRAGRQLHDINVLGTLGLLTAAAALPELEAIVIRSSAAIYGAEPAAPAFWRAADLPPGATRDRLRTRFQRDVAEIEQLHEAFSVPWLGTIVGPEEAVPRVGQVRGLARLTGLSAVPLTATFPLLGPLGAIGLPSEWRIAFGAPVAATDGAAAAEDRAAVLALADRVRQQVQDLVDEQLTQRAGAYV